MKKNSDKFFWTDRQTDRPTDNMTDRQTDIVAKREVALPKNNM